MNVLNKNYLLCSYKSNENFLNRYRLAKENDGIELQICKKIKLKLHRTKSRLKNLFVERAFPELKNKEIKKPIVDIFDEERNKKLVKEFLALGDIKIVERKEIN